MAITSTGFYRILILDNSFNDDCPKRFTLPDWFIKIKFSMMSAE